ncbi:glutamine--fructose-6-phosphate aminotransferase [isomerizing] [Pseudohongiella nitratireducens]|uniref:Glutamine--fructose-6-phosphate aminotransferase [isomerizing] n=1 Tax=Pseudohongiella nitratireducens TaxID=1768907 RepID=A0A917LV75_9GAMM|nr:glutamine--fructose-6-phosphate transaminase (isomerizing) [Pseudohongiella nitratireducens]GGG58681.1 glutamine--fructose-6-phosphate aminotransferase [isomerizing] [Pseudohongiella nitratireducens]|tara:strand:- start:8777 stop:10612 length:1836 start_codon:yes stop_codon:yes gene_type:complete
MCGIVGAVAQRNVTGILVEGLKRLEYRGYDSAGVAVLETENNHLKCLKSVGKVNQLAEKVAQNDIDGQTGIAHTRWATHGVPSEDNAHPHVSGDRFALVHNGIIENYSALRKSLQQDGYQFISETDTEVVVHLIHKLCTKNGLSLLEAVKTMVKDLHGAYGLCVIDKEQPDRLIVARSGSPLVIGVGIGENFVASDPLALGQVTDQYIYLEEGDIAEVTKDNIDIFANGEIVNREVTRIRGEIDDVTKGDYGHFMLKEIYEQSRVIQNTLNGRISAEHVLEESFGVKAKAIFDQITSVQIVACGTSHHAGLITKYWLESIAGIPCHVDIASDYRYRRIIVQPGTLFVTISQSGETADTLAALRYANELSYVASMAICNVATSSLVRESDFSLLTMAGREIGVASTKAFTTQLVALLLMTLVLGRRHGLTEEKESGYVHDLHKLPALVTDVLKQDTAIQQLSIQFADKHHALFLGRGPQYPVAKEGALKLKEISYIHAEAYPAGELKHGPLALVDDRMPVVAVAPNDELLGKLKGNLAEVSARGGKLFVFADESAGFDDEEEYQLIKLPAVPEVLAPILYTIPLQLLSYHVAILKGTDVDHPRNLAKSVTVE